MEFKYGILDGNRKFYRGEENGGGMDEIGAGGKGLRQP